MDNFKVECIFANVEFVGYMSNMCTVQLRLELSYGRLGIEFESYFVSLGPINMSYRVTVRRLGSWCGRQRGRGSAQMPV